VRAQNPYETWERRDVAKLNQLVLQTEHYAFDVYGTAIGFARSKLSDANLQVV
jgi:hypothetical protein